MWICKHILDGDMACRYITPGEYTAPWGTPITVLEVRPTICDEDAPCMVVICNEEGNEYPRHPNNVASCWNSDRGNSGMCAHCSVPTPVIVGISL